MNFADTTTLAEIQIARAEQAPGWDAGDAHDLRPRSEQEPHQHSDLTAARAEHQPADPARIDADTVRALVRADEACRAAQLVVDRLHEVIDSLPRNRVDKRDARFAATQAGYYLDDCLRALDVLAGEAGS
jgi:hypothetical protein